MSDAAMIALAWAAGGALGVLFFGGLWWTVRKVVVAKQPALWLLGSYLLRTGITAVGFYFVSAGHWERLLACLVGFVMGRVAVTRLTRTSEPTPNGEVRDAP